MTVDRRDPSSAIPQLEKRVTKLEKLSGGYSGEFAKAIHRHELEDVVGLNEALGSMATDKDVDAKITAAISAAHPVGSYYMSSDPTEPAELFGGTWEAVSIEPFEYCWRRIEEVT